MLLVRLEWHGSQEDRWQERLKTSVNDRSIDVASRLRGVQHSAEEDQPRCAVNSCQPHNPFNFCGIEGHRPSFSSCRTIAFFKTMACHVRLALSSHSGPRSLPGEHPEPEAGSR